MSSILRSITIVSLLLLAPSARADVQPEARVVAEQVLAAVGGAEGWAATRHLRFTFAGARTHHWDVETGNHRVEGTSRDGVRYVVLSNLNTRQGQVWLDGKPAGAEASAEWLERAYAAWINDTYWLLLPFKLLDPGVNLKLLDDADLNGKPTKVLELTFGDVGLTPGDRYRVYVDPVTHLIVRWDYVLESFEPGQEPTAWDWSGWEQHGKIKLATGRSMVGSDRQLPLTDIGVFEQLPVSVYEDSTPTAN